MPPQLPPEVLALFIRIGAFVLAELLIYLFSGVLSAGSGSSSTARPGSSIPGGTGT